MPSISDAKSVRSVEYSGEITRDHTGFPNEFHIIEKVEPPSKDRNSPFGDIPAKMVWSTEKLGEMARTWGIHGRSWILMPNHDITSFDNSLLNIGDLDSKIACLIWFLIRIFAPSIDIFGGTIEVALQLLPLSVDFTIYPKAPAKTVLSLA
jgi:hypothetical protein